MALNGLKRWAFKTFVAGTLLKQGYAYLDDYLTKRWPQRWPQLQFAMRGWVTYLGLAIGGVATGALWLADNLNASGETNASIWLLAKAGIFVAAVGVAIWILRWFIYLEATDRDGWLDDPNAKEPDPLTDSQLAVAKGQLDSVKEDLAEVAESTEKAKRTVSETRKKLGDGR
jgi:hypothetical protein